MIKAVHGGGNPGAVCGILNNDPDIFDGYARALKHLGVTGDMAAPLFSLVDAHGVDRTAEFEADPGLAEGMAGYRKAREMLGC